VGLSGGLAGEEWGWRRFAGGGESQLGIAVYSPRLDAKGNSVRGIMVCKELANRLGLHAFEFTNVGSSFVQAMM